jgi:hypothetical protein
MKKSDRRKTPKRVLRLPDLDFAKRSVLNTLGSPASKAAHAPDVYAELLRRAATENAGAEMSAIARGRASFQYRVPLVWVADSGRRVVPTATVGAWTGMWARPQGAATQITVAKSPTCGQNTRTY